PAGGRDDGSAPTASLMSGSSSVDTTRLLWRPTARTVSSDAAPAAWPRGAPESRLCRVAGGFERRRSVFDGASDLLAQFGCILVAVHGHGMLDCGLHKFGVRICIDCDGAPTLARHFAAVDEPASHGDLPWTVPALKEKIPGCVPGPWEGVGTLRPSAFRGNPILVESPTASLATSWYSSHARLRRKHAPMELEIRGPRRRAHADRARPRQADRDPQRLRLWGACPRQAGRRLAPSDGLPAQRGDAAGVVGGEEELPPHQGLHPSGRARRGSGRPVERPQGHAPAQRQDREPYRRTYAKRLSKVITRPVEPMRIPELSRRSSR